VSVQVIWQKVGTERVDDYTFLYAEGNEDHQLGTGYSYTRESNQQLGE
jgi:hypothetical protein